MKVTVVTVDPVEVLSVTARGGLAGAKAAFERLEGCFPSLRGRRFYGAMESDGTYRACVARLEGDDPERLGVDLWSLPGGRYARTKIADWEERTDEIGPAFAAMAADLQVDLARPSIEFYRSQRELILLLPIEDR